MLLALGEFKTALWHFSQHLAGLIARPVPASDAGRGKGGAWFRFHRELCTGCLYLGATLQSLTVHDLAVAFLLRSAGACHTLAEGYLEAGPAEGPSAQTEDRSTGGERTGSRESMPLIPRRPLATLKIRLGRSSENPERETVKIEISLDREACAARRTGSAKAGAPEGVDKAGATQDTGFPAPATEVAIKNSRLRLDLVASTDKPVNEVRKGLQKEDLRIRSWLACAVNDLERQRAGFQQAPTTPVGAARATVELVFREKDEELGTFEDKVQGGAAAGEDSLSRGEEDDEDWDKELEIEEMVRTSFVSLG